MMRKWIGYALAGAVIVFAAAAAPALAASQPFNSNLDDTLLAPWNDEGRPVFSNYFQDGGDTMDPLDCTTDVVNDTWCRGNFFGPPKGGPAWRGPNSDIVNYDGVDGQMYHAVWSAELGVDTAEHRGYYAWVCKTVNVGEDSDWQPPDCVGDAQPATCIGNPDPTEVGPAADFWGGPDPSVNPQDALTPMPIPYQVDDGTPNDELVTLEWNAVQAQGECTSEADYSLYYYIDDLSDGVCNQPTAADLTFLKTVTTNTATVNVVDELGINLDDAKGVVWALKLFFPQVIDANRGNWDKESLYFSGNSLCTSFDTGLAAEVINLAAQHVGGRNVSVTWETSLEQNVRGFYVTRSFTADGQYQRVSQLIPAAGEPSTYSFVDKIDMSGTRTRVSGLFYKIEVIDNEDNVSTFGPTSVERPDTPTRIRAPQDRELRRDVR
jgi:hypothetical protein